MVCIKLVGDNIRRTLGREIELPDLRRRRILIAQLDCALSLERRERYEVAGPDGSGNRDSIAVVRSNSAMTRLDTVARLSPVEIQEVQRNSGTIR